MARRSGAPYIHFADIYDQIMADVPYHMWADFVAGIWSKHSFSPSSVLDLACGTGNVSLLLARRGYQVTGVDLSSRMLQVARKKLSSAGLYAEFIRADMRSFKLAEPVDAAISLFDSINYLLEPDDVMASFRCVADALKPGGMFVFDVNTPKRLSAIKQEIHIFDGPGYYLVWSDSYDSAHGWWKVRLTGFIRPPGEDGGRTDNKDNWTRFDEVHRERAFPIADVSAHLKDAGFSVLAVYDSCSFRQASDSTSRAYLVAKKE